MGNWLTSATSDGKARAYLATPTSGSGPAVLVCHAWWGLNEFFVDFCDRLAAEGFVVLAADMYAGRKADTVAGAEALMAELKPDERAEAVQTTALDALLARPETTGDRVGVVGFSMGAAYALWLSTLRPEQVAAVAIFYGTMPGSYTTGDAAILGHFAVGDEWEPDDGVDELEAALRAAGREVEFHRIEGVGHWFIENNRPDVYNATAADLAWRRTLAFLHDRLG